MTSASLGNKETNASVNPLKTKQFNGDWSTPCWQCYGTTGGNTTVNHFCQCFQATPLGWTFFGAPCAPLGGCWGPGAIVARSNLSGEADKCTGKVCCFGPCNVAGIGHCAANCLLTGLGAAVCGIGLCVPAIHTTFVASQYRNKHNIAGNPVYDFLCSLCCIGCFTGQVLREIELREGTGAAPAAASADHPKDAPAPVAAHQPAGATWTQSVQAYPDQAYYATSGGPPAGGSGFVSSGPVQM